jgi:RHS repeat-associated protein
VGVVKFLWDGPALAERWTEKRDGTTGQAVTWHIEQGSFTPFAQETDDGLFPILTDQVGLPKVVFDEDGKQVWKATYSLWGKLLPARRAAANDKAPALDTTLRFRGQWADDESGLSYNLNRYYDPDTGQHLTSDPIGLAGGLRTHAYVHDPMQLYDPLALAECAVGDTVSDTVRAARLRQAAMLDADQGFNVSPVSWDKYPTIGRNGSYITDLQGITDITGPLNAGGVTTISTPQAAQLEQAMGLERGSLADGFKVRQVDGITGMSPRSPMEGNQYFQGAGQHLPGGAPEMVVDSIPTTDSANVSTITTVNVQ